MEIINSLNKSLELFDNFEKELNINNNNLKIINCIKVLTDDLLKYKTTSENVRFKNLSEKEKNTIKLIISRIDDLNKIVSPKNEIKQKFDNFNNLK